MANEVMAYNVRSKAKEPMINVVIDINSKGRYFAKGVSKKDKKTVMCTAMGKDNAVAAVKSGAAKKGTGWGK